MRITQIESDLQEAYNHINFTVESISNSNNAKLKGGPESFAAIQKIEKYNAFEKEINDLKSMPNIYDFRSTSNQITLNQNEANRVKALLEIIKDKIKTSIAVINYSAPEKSDNVVNIKLPAYSDLSQLTYFFKNLDLALRTGLKIEGIDGEYKINNFEHGSFWIGVVIAKGLEQFIKLINAAMDSYKKSIEIRSALEVLKQSKVLTDTMTDIEQGLKAQIDELTRQSCSGFTDGISHAGEESTLKSVQILTELIIQGTRFEAPDKASSKVQQAFPKDEEYNKLPKPQILITNKVSVEKDEEKSDSDDSK